MTSDRLVGSRVLLDRVASAVQRWSLIDSSIIWITVQVLAVTGLAQRMFATSLSSCSVKFSLFHDLVVVSKTDGLKTTWRSEMLTHLAA